MAAKLRGSMSIQPADREPINPYAASPIGDAPLTPGRQPGEEPVRHYQARLTWSDREALLCSVGPARIAAVFGAILQFKAVYKIAQPFCAIVYHFPDEGDIVQLGVMAVSFLTVGLASLYLCWAMWRYAEVVRRIAGGSATTMADWSRLHYRTIWLAAAVALSAFALKASYWFVGILPG
jgi:hypothetical protein